jgi:hypothetical protein
MDTSRHNKPIKDSRLALLTEADIYPILHWNTVGSRCSLAFSIIATPDDEETQRTRKPASFREGPKTQQSIKAYHTRRQEYRLPCPGEPRTSENLPYTYLHFMLLLRTHIVVRRQES